MTRPRKSKSTNSPTAAGGGETPTRHTPEDELIRLGSSPTFDTEAPSPRHKHQDIIDSLLALERGRLAKLCDRLGIDNNLSELERWILVGRALARTEPEFVADGPGQPRRGRPAKLHEDRDDIRRAKVLYDAATDWYNSPNFDGRELPLTE